MRRATYFLLALLGAAADSRQDISLGNIILSSGSLRPPFSPDIYDYKVDLQYPVDQIAISPRLPSSYFTKDGNNMPSINMSWKNCWNGKEESSSLAVKRQIDLPDDGETLPVNIKVSDSSSNKSITYKVTVKQANGKPAILKAIEGSDNDDYGIIVAPFVTEDASIYDVYVKPSATYVKMRFYCSGNSNLQVNGKKQSNGSVVKIKRERDHHKQAVEVVCSKGGFGKDDTTRNYVVHLISDFYPQDVTIPEITLNNSGQKCPFNKDKRRFICPDPKDGGKKARVTGKIDPSIRYTIESPDKAVEVRMLNGQPTIPFTYRTDLNVVATSGRYTEKWPLRFEGGVMPGVMRLMGGLLALVLAALLFALIFVVGFAKLCGIGIPLGATEIVSTATLLLQYLCFSTYMRGSSSLSDLIAPLKWITLFWPLPFQMDDPAGTHHKARKLFEAAPSAGVNLWGDSYLGDATDVRNGLGAMFFGTILLGLLLLIHVGVLCYYLYHKYNTLPHRIKLGHWESILLHWMVFPVCTGASMVLFHQNTSTMAKVLAGLVLAVYGIWLGCVFVTIYNRVRKREVTWVWQSSTREDGILESDYGYWCDVICDQLTTHPVDRSFFGKIFKWKWISTVADIEPINIYPNNNKIKQNDTFGPNDYYNHHAPTAVPISKTPKTVEVVRTVSTPKIAPGQRLSVGLVRASWLDMLFTYQSLIALHNQVVHDTSRSFTIPVTVKLMQLTGPYTGGSNAYFFDGARVPFIRVFDSIFRILLGVFMGLALASQRHSTDGLAFGGIFLLALISFGYIMYTKPYSRHIENFMSSAVSGSIALGAFPFMVYALMRKEPSSIIDVLLWFVAVLCFIIAIYALIIIISVFSAIICPPLDETRFLESIANCNVTISNHNDNESWAVDIPAYTKYTTRNLKASCSSSGKKLNVSMYQSGDSPTLEFSVRDVANACRTGQLAVPRVSVVAPSNNNDVLGYRHLNVYDDHSTMVEVGHFLSGDQATRHIADGVAQQIEHQTRRGGSGRNILLVTVIPPRSRYSSSSSTSSLSSRKTN